MLQEAGIQTFSKSQPQKTEMARHLRSAYVLIEAADGYQVVFSVAEVFPESGGRNVVLVDRKNGEPLDAKTGPYQVVVSDSVRYERWIRQVRRILVRPATTSPSPSKKAAGPEATAKTGRKGGLYLVGMGPGDAELVTIKAARILKEADRVYCFDYLKDQVARYVPPERLSVVPFMLLGKLVGQSEQQAPANLREQVRRSEAEMSRFVPEVRRLVAAGKMLAFADAGDPTIYCPWSWILERFADLSPTVVPGLSSFNAANAALRRSITRHSGSILLTAGDDLGTADAKGRLNTTLVIFTMGRRFRTLCPGWPRYPADTPIAVVCEASYLSEKVVVATLGTILPKLADSQAASTVFDLRRRRPGGSPPARRDGGGLPVRQRGRRSQTEGILASVRAKKTAVEGVDLCCSRFQERRSLYE